MKKLNNGDKSFLPQQRRRRESGTCLASLRSSCIVKSIFSPMRWHALIKIREGERGIHFVRHSHFFRGGGCLHTQACGQFGLQLRPPVAMISERRRRYRLDGSQHLHAHTQASEDWLLFGCGGQLGARRLWREGPSSS